MSSRFGVRRSGVDLLVKAGAVLATSLDLPTTMSQVARLTVPDLADVCVIDLVDDDGSIRKAAVAAEDERLARALEDLRERFPLDPGGAHPVARVIRSGEPELLAEMDSSLLRSIAQGPEHARFMIDHDYRSAIVVPLAARGRTLGALSALRLGEGVAYAGDDLEFVGELARRAGLAIDNARLYSELRQVEQRLQAVLGNLAEAITMEDEHGQTVFANEAAVALLGASSPEELTSAAPGSIMPRFLVLDEQGNELALADMPGRRLFAGEQPGPLLVRNIVRASGEERWLVVRASPVVDEGTKRIVYVVNVFENITEFKRAELAETFMAEASRVLVSSTDPRATLQKVARLAVPQIADWCAVHLIDEHDELERVALHHSDPALVARSEELERQSPPAVDGEDAIGEVIRTGRARIFTDVQASAPDASKLPPGLEGLRKIGARSVIVVPLLGAMKTAVGTITLASVESVRRLTPADLGLAVRLGRRSGTAVERARIYTERARIAHILQRALLPESLPQVPGAEVQALYLAAGELNEVGGDFYDVFHYEPDCWMLVVGDVCGKGPRAAGVTALARHTLRASALSGQSPTGMLETLHRALHRQPPGADLCTACLVTLGPDEGSERLTVALAGHQPALLIDRDGAATPLGTSGTLLGVVDPVRITEVKYELELGQTVLLYTDGVIEAGRPGEQLGEAGLRAICARAPELDLIGLLEEIERAALERASGSLHDDIALLGLRLAPAA